MCNVVLTIAVLDTYTSSFFLSAMSVARHCTVAGALHPGRRGAPWASGVRSLLWVTAVLATTLTALRGGVSICACCASATAAPTDLQKIAVAFVLPLATLGTCWLRRLLQRRRAGWQSRVRPRWRSLARALLVFVVCWLPHQALTLLGGGGGGVLIELTACPGTAHTSWLRVSICLARSNSCLNPLLCCLLRPDFRQGLQELCGRATHRIHLQAGSVSRAPEPVLPNQA
jgi:hypothetical protein